MDPHVHAHAQQVYELLSQRPAAPIHRPIEDLVDDNQIITEQNHPFDAEAEDRFGDFYPSFVGKTWGAMKQMEYNRTNTDFFTSQYLDQQLRDLYACLQRTDTIEDIPNFNQCISTWQENPSEGLQLSGAIKRSNCPPLDTIPQNVHTLMAFSRSPVNIPIALAERSTLVALCIRTEALPVMPYIQILHLAVSDYDNISGQHIHTSFDFSEWTSLRILKIRGVKSTDQIRLPSQLISLTLCVGKSNGTNQTFESMFGEANDQRVVFQSLKHLKIDSVNWPTLPTLSNCHYFTMLYCDKLEIVEVPKCRSIMVNRCKSFTGFGPLTLLHNDTLDTITLYKLCKDRYYQLPIGSPTGYRHVIIFCARVYTLPVKFASHAYISIMDAGSKLYIKDQQARDTLEFYFDHTILTYIDDNSKDKIASSDLCIPRQGETLREMINRLYGFNWSHFARKIQRQFRFKCYMKNIHQPLLKQVTTQDICIHEIARYLGASKSFKIACSNH